jgi:hypothetical protein
LDIKDDCARGFKYVVGDGKKAHFWHDTWIGECPLKIAFPHLFEICNQQDSSVYRVFNQGDIVLSCRRNFGDREDLDLAELSDMIVGTSFIDSRDTVKWVL